MNFDVESDDNFLTSLGDIGPQTADFVLSYLLQTMAGQNWGWFCRTHEWRLHPRQPIDTFPGAVDIYRFTVQLPPRNALAAGKSGRVRIRAAERRRGLRRGAVSA